MSSTFVQGSTQFIVTTALGADKVLLRSFSGTEGMSVPFHFTLDMVAQDSALDASQVVGQGATITATFSGGKTRYWHGIVTRFAQGGTDVRFTRYTAEIRPWLWMLTLTKDSRIFQNQTVPDIITSVFDNLGYKDYSQSLTKTYAQRIYCVQYNETAYDFVCRLMEDEGIFYFFQHADGKHTLMLADDASACQALANFPTVSFSPEAVDLERDSSVTSLDIEQQVVSSAYATDDYNFQQPTTELYAKAQGSSATPQVYEYPGGYTDKGTGDGIASLRVAELALPGKWIAGESGCMDFTSGYKVTLKDHPRSDANADYVLSLVNHSGSQEHYSNSFEAYPASVTFHPPRVTPRPRIFGSQTAVVTGKSGEEISTDNFGRVTVKFPWDQYGKSDETSSCWIRVSQGWAGKSYGIWFLPRIGQEVVVSYLEGDPDRPLVTGSVYNADQTLPYALPGEMTKSTIKSNTSKGGGGFNEFRFEDKQGSEEVYLHAQKDMNIDIVNNRGTTIEQGNDTLTIKKGNRTVEVSTGNESTTVKGTRSLSITGNETHSNEADFSHTVKGNYSLTVSGNLTISVTGNIDIKASGNLTNEATGNLTSKATGSLTSQATGSLTNKGASITHDAQGVLESKAGGTQTVQASGMLQLQGSLIKIG
jgi:type VI secretion system secreted protein VgrG